MNREVGLTDRAPAHGRRDAGQHGRRWPARSPTRRAASSTWCSPSSTSRSTRCRARASGPLQDLPLPVLKANLARLAGRASPTSAGTRSTGTTTTSRGPSRASATTPPSTASPPPRPSATVLHLHRGTPYVYQGEELGMTNAGFTAHRRVRRPRVAQLGPRGRWHAGCPRPTCSGRWRSRAATTRAPRCSGTPPRAVASRPVRRGCRPTPTATWSTRRPRSPTRTRSSTTTGG